jgi:cysteine desulfuration protein SufE
LRWIISSFQSCLNKQHALKSLFKECHNDEDKYKKIIHIGQQLSPYPPMRMTKEHTVHGCQSTMYLYTYLENARVRFHAHSEALISAGLAALLLTVYDDEPPEVILQCPPLFLEELGIKNALSPGRANGLSSLFLKMKQDALQFYLQQTNKSL